MSHGVHSLRGKSNFWIRSKHLEILQAFSQNARQIIYIRFPLTIETSWLWTFWKNSYDFLPPLCWTYTSNFSHGQSCEELLFKERRRWTGLSISYFLIEKGEALFAGQLHNNVYRQSFAHVRFVAGNWVIKYRNDIAAKNEAHYSIPVLRIDATRLNRCFVVSNEIRGQGTLVKEA